MCLGYVTPTDLQDAKRNSISVLKERVHVCQGTCGWFDGKMGLKDI